MVDVAVCPIPRDAMPLWIDVHLTGDVAQAPRRATAGSAGFDLCAAEGCVIQTGTRRLVGTGVRLSMHATEKGIGGASVPPSLGVYARVAPRSGLAVKGIDVAAGVCDQDYQGEYKVLLVNNSGGPFVVLPGDRIAQLVFETCHTDVRVSVVSEASKLRYGTDGTDGTPGSGVRGEGGFGSTGA